MSRRLAVLRVGMALTLHHWPVEGFHNPAQPARYESCVARRSRGPDAGCSDARARSPLTAQVQTSAVTRAAQRHQAGKRDQHDPSETRQVRYIVPYQVAQQA